MKFCTRGFWTRFAIGVGSFLLLLVAYIYFPWQMAPAESFEVVAHRGVFQTFPLDNLANDTCTAKIIYPPTHAFLENTLPSMQEAFDKGATVVEFDIHRTADDHLIVFHDWTVECRTEGRGVTNELTLAYLQSLDIGYGYTADGGQSFPLRGQGVGLMPTLEEVMAAFPDKRFVINNKDGGDETRELLMDFLKTLTPEARSRLSYWGVEYPKLKAEIPEIDTYIFARGEMRACFWNYIGMLVTGRLAESCRQNIIGIPSAALDAIPGWPNLILARAHQAGARVYVADVDTPEQWARLKDLPLDGIQTNRIEVIGPLLKQER